MATTSIQWTDRVWNPTTGCDKVSPGCAHCYAETIAGRFWTTQYPPILVPTVAGEEARPRQFTDVQTHEDRLSEPLSWRKPARVFVNSMSDLFHEVVPDEFILSVFSVMERTPRHTFQVLTKRPERMLEWVTKHAEWVDYAAGAGEFLRRYGHVWLGVSVENQHFADERIQLLLQTPAAVRFISAEPLLGPVDLSPWLPVLTIGGVEMERWLDWVIVGGESGPGARPFDLAWGRSIVEQCQVAGVPVFVKQLGSKPVMSDVICSLERAIREGGYTLRDRKGGTMEEWPADLRVREFPITVKHASGAGVNA